MHSLPAASRVQHLRSLLAQHFSTPPNALNEAVLESGLPEFDALKIPCGALTEIISQRGCNRLLYRLLQTWLAKHRAILIDGRNAFDPQALRQKELNRLLWLRCENAAEAIKSADLVVRDGNISLVILLFALNTPTEMRRVPATAWHRLQMLAEKSGVTLLLFNREAQAQCARLRLCVSEDSDPVSLTDLYRVPEELPLSLTVDKRRRKEWKSEDFSQVVRNNYCP
jgi:hypothetical protein